VELHRGVGTWGEAVPALGEDEQGDRRPLAAPGTWACAAGGSAAVRVWAHDARAGHGAERWGQHPGWATCPRGDVRDVLGEHAVQAWRRWTAAGALGYVGLPHGWAELAWAGGAAWSSRWAARCWVEALGCREEALELGGLAKGWVARGKALGHGGALAVEKGRRVSGLVF
jgi:hypothetical protein